MHQHAAQSRGLRIGFLPFYVDYYEGICPGLVEQKMDVARRCAQTLGQFGSVVWDGHLIKNADAAAAVGKALAAQAIDVAVAVTTIAVFGGISWAAIQPLPWQLPLLLFNAQQIETVGPGYSMTEIVRNTGQIGIQALANTLLREGRPFRVVTGQENSTRTLEELKRLLGVIRAVKAVRGARLLAVGTTFPLMTDIELDDDYAAQHLGAAVSRIAPADWSAAYREVNEAHVRAEMARCRDNNKIVELTDDELHRSARIAVALQSLVEQHEAVAGTLNCHVENCLRNKEIGITACYALGVQNQQGRSFTCTGDLPTALAMLMLKSMTGAAMYTEVQVMDEKRQAVVIANSGEGEDGIRHPAAQSCVRGNDNFKGMHGRGASFAYPLRPGPATIASLTPTPNGAKPFRLIAIEGEILNEALPSAGALAGFFRFSHTDLWTGYRFWLESGAVHHAATAPGHHAQSLSDIAGMLDIEFVSI